jgi:hypothetical protein
MLLNTSILTAEVKCVSVQTQTSYKKSELTDIDATNFIQTPMHAWHMGRR